MTVNQYGQLDKPTIGDRLEQLEETIKLLETRITLLEDTPFIPDAPDVFDPSTNKCSICNIDFSNTMGYVCDNMACPMYPKVGDNYAPSSTGG